MQIGMKGVSSLLARRGEGKGFGSSSSKSKRNHLELDEEEWVVACDMDATSMASGQKIMKGSVDEEDGEMERMRRGIDFFSEPLKCSLSLPTSYSQFVLNYRMNRIESTIPELINMLKDVEPSL
ncbi:hypothetical protein ZIOFF_071263 [Zingiber officinale]|uniref:Uncharacterized protein n=1 Tax=Zingiber officinale TaxID=94328 RepID=A0A8J5C3I7_ZINOF|nr:hypothetical protein ZIOFF_071263 [Zingiber officinale]